MTDAPGVSEPSARPVLDRPAFEHLTMVHRRELKLHCYRMMGSLHEADDLVQETFLNAWRGRAQFDGRGSPRGWLYTIATNACLNAIKTRVTRHRILEQPDRPPAEGRAAAGPAAELSWLEPYPDVELPDLVDGEPGPEARYETSEAIRLAFVAAIQLLPPRQRASLLLCDVLGWSAAETAQLLGGSTASINSALQRARATLARHYPAGRPLQRSQPNPEEGLLLERYISAWRAANLDGFIELLRPPITCRHGTTGTRDAPRSTVSSGVCGAISPATSRWRQGPTVSPRLRSTRGAIRSRNGARNRCMSSSRPMAGSHR
ncbi:RNA polymerase subunit sigma-70 [Mesorhizobium sp. B1-1-9]|uniref:RNA polymerase subunit sigma-70 n=1 Tax=Mesorhizobium sp. B1-1-9 TaxID=2589975 RepID=UPI001FED2E6D|nr:RNA polymerase subunit sigma-70 [Mesorhizobium sp. B1-1-9]